MGYEIIDRLCEVTEKLAEIVKEQAEIIEQSNIPDEVKETFRDKRNDADTDLDSIEYRLRKYRA